MGHDSNFKDSTGIGMWLLVVAAFVGICAPALIALSRLQF